MNGNLCKSLFAGLSFAAILATVLIAPTNSRAQYDNTGYGYRPLFNNTTGSYNTALGFSPLYYNTTGSDNTAVGYHSLTFNTDGRANVAIGFNTLYNNTTGYLNSASGAGALFNNTTGYYNVASGSDALTNNTTGYFNTASGAYSLSSNTTGYLNTSSGSFALYYNTTGIYNSATGSNALYNNSTGEQNTAIGVAALYSNTVGSANIAMGWVAGNSITSGNGNIALGTGAGNSITTGSGNIALGYIAGDNITVGSNNIAIGNRGLNTDADTIRIGTSGIQKQAYIAGITGVGVTGAAVYVTTGGQLGVLKSSRRFKYDIRGIGSTSDKLMDLRPVMFRYKDAAEDGTHPLQYGLIAEEVAKVYPELVQYDKQGKPFTVYYHLLTPIMLDQLQKAHHQLDEQQREFASLKTTMQNQSITLQSQITSIQHTNQLLLAGAAALILVCLVGGGVFLVYRVQPKTAWRARVTEGCA